MIRFLPFLAGSILVHVVVLLCCGAVPIDAVDPGLEAHPTECVYVTLQAPAPDTAVEPTSASEAAPASVPSSSSSGASVLKKETTTEEPIEPPAEEPADKPVEKRAVPTPTDAVLSEEPVRESSVEPPEPTTAPTSPEPPKKAMLALDSETPEYRVVTKSDWNRVEPDSNPKAEVNEVGAQPAVERTSTKERTQSKQEKEASSERAGKRAETAEPPPEASGRPALESAPRVASAATRFHAGAGEDMLRFRDRVLDSIRRSIYFPRNAWRKRKHGETTVAFVIGRDGGLLEVDIAKSSGHPSLDEAALKIVRKAGEGFPPIPSSCRQGSIRYVVPIIFKRTRSDNS